MVHSAQDQGWKGSLHLAPSLSPLCAEITAHAFTSAVVERQEQRTKTPWSLDINLITTRLSTATNRYVVNRFPRSLSKCPLNTTWGTAPRRWQVHVLTVTLIEWLYWNFGQLLVYEKTGFRETCNVS